MRGVSLAVQVRSGAQVTAVGESLDALVERVAGRLPADLAIVKTSDQPELVRTKIDEFLRSLLEAVAIVIAIALVFMERRSAILVAASIPITLAMTFGFMQLLGLDLQQVSIAALIISLGLLVDDPVIASDAINRELAAGVPRRTAAWQGPVRLAKAIFFATLTNVVAFAPLLLVSGSMGEFIYALPMVVSLALVSSRIVSMTFMPLLGYYLLRGQRGYEASLEGDGRAARLARGYNAVTEWMLRHKRKTALGFLAFLVIGLAPALLIRTQFFPDEAMARFYVHVRLPDGADVRATDALLREAESTLLAAEGDRIERVTTYVGSGGPRWWSNVGPEPRNPAYGMMLVQARDPEATRTMIGRVQRLLTGQVPGARFEVHRVSSGKPAVVPVEVRVSGPDPTTLRLLAEEVKSVLRAAPETTDVFDDWGAEAMNVDLVLDPARAAAAGVTATDVARSSALALAGTRETQLRVGDQLIDIVVRLRPGERSTASQVGDLYVWSERTGRAVPLEQVARVGTGFAAQKIVRHDLERTITIGAMPKDGALASTLLASAQPGLAALDLPAGYHVELGGEHELQAKAFASVAIALKVSIALIFLVLVWQFAHVFKPLIVFAAIPFGMVGVVLGLTVTNTNFGFMAFLGVASLIGVIVSHIIVLFDFIEEAREHGVGLHRAVIDAGLVRLRPVLVTVLATVGGLIPLALEGGPMWRQLVYVQIGGLLLATLVTKGVVPLLYVVFTDTFKLIRWEREA
ncbi:MAG: efflux RND transporter permease subunit [Kofleriaceae bacterium]|nr:MAG: efflux RND transporter permease subunit [Kofleriaceae bacterium]